MNLSLSLTNSLKTNITYKKINHNNNKNSQTKTLKHNPHLTKQPHKTKLSTLHFLPLQNNK